MSASFAIGREFIVNQHSKNVAGQACPLSPLRPLRPLKPAKVLSL